MSNKHEAAAFTAFRDGCVRLHDRADRIENILGDGMPDANCCFEGIEFWMEVKAPDEPKRKKTPLFGSNHPVSQEQMNWFLSQRNAGGFVFLYIDTDKRRMLVSTVIADEINKMTVDNIEQLAIWSETKPMKKGGWDELRRAILEHCER